MAQDNSNSANKPTDSRPAPIEILTKFLDENKLELAVLPPKFQFLASGDFIIEKPLVQVQYKKEEPAAKIN